MTAGEGAENENDLRSFLLGVPLGSEERKKIVSALAKEVSMKQETVDFLHLLVDVNRMDAIEDIITAFDEKYNTLTDTQVCIQILLSLSPSLTKRPVPRKLVKLYAV